MINLVDENLTILGTIDFIDNGLIYGLLYNTNFIYPYYNIEIINDTTIQIRDFYIIKFLKIIKLKNIPKPINFKSFYQKEYIYDNYKNLIFIIKQLKETDFTDEETELLDNEYKNNENNKLIIEDLLFFYSNMDFDLNLTFEYFLDELKNIFNLVYKALNIKTNTVVTNFIYDNNFYIINDDNQPYIIKESIIYFCPLFSNRNNGDRLGNRLFNFFRTLTYIYKDIINNSIIEYIFIYSYDNNISNLLKKYIIICNKYNDILKLNKRDNIIFYNFNNINKIYQKYYYYSHDILEILLNNKLIKYNFMEFINKNIKIQKFDDTDKIKISLHYRLSDYCSGNTNNKLYEIYEKYTNVPKLLDDEKLNCFNNNYVNSDEGKKVNILSFIYYKNCIENIIKNNPDKKNFLIIIYYLKTLYDNIIIKLFIIYIKKNFTDINIEFKTEYEYYTEQLNELDLIYNSSLNDIVILSNSTFGFWMIFFKILNSYKNNTTELNTVYYGKYLYYLKDNSRAVIDEINSFLYIDKMYITKLNESKYILENSNLLHFNNNCIINNDSIYYFKCLLKDRIRIILIILYFKYKYNTNINNINEAFINSINDIEDLSLLKSKCFIFIQEWYMDFSKIHILQEPFNIIKNTDSTDIDLNYIIELVSFIDNPIDEPIKKKYYKYKINYLI